MNVNALHQPSEAQGFKNSSSTLSIPESKHQGFSLLLQQWINFAVSSAEAEAGRDLVPETATRTSIELPPFQSTLQKFGVGKN